MANDDFTKEQMQVWSYLSELDLSNSYNLYQRRYNRYPRRLPKLGDYPIINSSNRSRENDLEISTVTPPEEEATATAAAMPLTPIDHLFGKREKCGENKDGMDEEVMKMTLEDFQDDEEAEVNKDMLLPKPSSTSNMCGSPVAVVKLNSHKSPSLSRREGVVPCSQSGVYQNRKGKHSSPSLIVPSSPPASESSSPIYPLQDKARCSPTKKNYPKSHKLLAQPVSNRYTPTYPSSTSIPISNLCHSKKVNQRSYSLSVPKSYTGRSSPIQLDDVAKSYSSSGKKVRLRCQSLCGQSSPRGSPINLKERSPKPGSQSPTNETFNLISMLKSQKETSSIKKMMQSEKECPRIIAAQKRRHTIHPNLLSDDTVIRNKRGVKINNITSKMHDTCISNEVNPTVNVKDVHQTSLEPEKEIPVVVPQISEKLNDRTSKDSFFHNCLMLANTQMKLLEDKSFEIDLVGSGKQKIKGQPISSQIALTLRMLLFGSGSSSFPASWRNQAISFVQPEHYGLKFHKDGPVELITSLQAYVLKNLLFVDIAKKDFDPQQLAPSSALQIHILIMSICDMIWKVGEKVHAIISLPNNACQFIQEYCYKNDDITEKMELFRFTNRDNLGLFVKQNIQKFMDIGNLGCISLLYSLMLTRGLSNILDDCCERKRGILECSSLTERSQSLINLCIYGKAVPNVFNKDVEVYNESEDMMIIHKGLEKRSEIGYLSYSEFINSKICEVGSCLKTPQYPIWILDNNGTLSVLFSVKRNLLSDWRLERRFDLYYYQGIAKYVPTIEIDVRLTMNTIQTLVDNEYEDERSTLEETLRTKWKDCVIEWNGYTRF